VDKSFPVYILRLQNGFITFCNCTAVTSSTVCKQGITKVINYRMLISSLVTVPFLCHSVNRNKYYSTFSLKIRNYGQTVICNSSKFQVACTNRIYNKVNLDEPITDDGKKYLVPKVISGGTLKGSIVLEDSTIILGDITLQKGIAGDFARWYREYIHPVVAYSVGVKIDRLNDNKILNACGFSAVFYGDIKDDETKTRIGRKLSSFNTPSDLYTLNDLIDTLQIREQIQDLQTKEVIYHEESRSL